MTAEVIHGDCIEAMREMPESSIHAIVTDPPYGLGFMGKAWDALPPGEEWARECLRVLKPGGHLLAFGGTRTWHRLAVAVEDAGFEIRDSIAWMHSQGFPKGKSSLKPAFEPVVVGRKRATRAGVLNIDACRIAISDTDRAVVDTRSGAGKGTDHNAFSAIGRDEGKFKSHAGGRWPANVVLDEAAAGELDQQTGTLTSPKPYANNGITTEGPFLNRIGGVSHHKEYGDEGGASRFFYVAKASTRERPTVDGTSHPTVKPLKLMRWLVRLVTPEGGTVLDPFAGSGTTLEAATLEGFHAIGIEREAEYLPLIHARLTRVDGVLAS